MEMNPKCYRMKEKIDKKKKRERENTNVKVSI